MDFKPDSISLFLLFLSNLWYAVTKKSLSSAIPDMKKKIGFTNKNIGECSANFSLLYGSFKLIGGVLADIFPADFLFTLGLALGSVINLCIPIVQHGQYISYFWGMNGLLQGMGGPALSKIVIDNIPADRKSAVWSNLFTANNIGYFSSPYMLLIPLRLLGWQGPFWFAGVIGLLIAIPAWIYPISSCIHSPPYPSNGNFRKIEKEETTNIVSPTHEMITKQLTTPLSQCSRFVATILLILSNSLTYFIIKAISDWKVPYLLETTSMDMTTAIEIVLWCEVGGMCGSYLAGCVADWFPSAHHWIHIYALCLTLFFLLLLLPPPELALAIPALSIRFLLPAYDFANFLRSYLFENTFFFHPNSWCFRVCLFAVGFGMNAPKALLLLHATEASVQFLKPYMNHVPTGTISGLIGFLAQVGASGSGHVMGFYVDQSFHWYFYILSFGASVLLLSLVLSHMFFVLEEVLKESVKVRVKVKEQ